MLAFFVRDDVSWQAPGRRDTVVCIQDGIKTKVQKRYMLFNLHEAHSLFHLEFPQHRLSATSFQELRPPYVLLNSAMSQRTCVCVYHANVDLLLKALDKHLDWTIGCDLRSFTTAMVCDEESESCMTGMCRQCEPFFHVKVDQCIKTINSTITWTQWTTDNKRVSKKDFTGTVEECVKVLAGKLPAFLVHVFVKRQQSRYFEQLKLSVDECTILVQLDYSENFSMIEQDEIQSAHFSKKQLSLFTAHAWCRNSSSRSFVFVSSHVEHNKYSIHAALEHLLCALQRSEDKMQEIVFFSDGAASQFKQRFLFKNLSHLSRMYNVLMSWHFFATSHGKGVVDGLGGTIKRMVHQAILSGQVCRNAQDFVTIARSKTTVIHVEEILESEVEGAQEELEEMFNNVKAVPGIQKVHSVTVLDVNLIQCKHYSQSDRSFCMSFK